MLELPDSNNIVLSEKTDALSSAGELDGLPKALRQELLELRRVKRACDQLRDSLTELTGFHALGDTAAAAVSSKGNLDPGFIVAMSHDIRTPMNGIIGMAELLAKTELDEKQQTFLDTIRESSASLLEIITDILDFSRMKAGQLNLCPEAFTISEVIEDAVTMVSAQAREKDLDIVTNVSLDLSKPVVGDIGKLRQILKRLLDTAIKHTDSGHVAVKATGKPDNTGQTVVTFRIEGTGTNASKADYEKALDYADGSLAHEHPGADLALLIAASLVSLMGGKIGLDNEVCDGVAVCVDVTLPICKKATA